MRKPGCGAGCRWLLRWPLPMWAVALFAIAVALRPLPIAAAPAPLDPLVRLHYDAEVASYCGLVDAALREGFRRRLRALRRSTGFDDADLQRARMDAWQAAHAEWQNRGLGGFRRWCALEGRAAADGLRGATER